MRTIRFLSLFLLSSLSVKAQSFKTNLHKTIISVNSILYQNKEAQFSGDKDNSYYLRKINASVHGQVFCLDSLANVQTKANHEIFNILKVKAFVINGNNISLMGINQQKTTQITNIRNQDLYALKKELSALKFICTLYSEQDPKFKCD